MEEQLTLVIITGLSGAGKTHALRRLEDAGFFCADNLPFRLLPAFVEQCKSACPPISQAAVVVDSREIAFGADWAGLLRILDGLDAQTRMVFLDCGNEELLRRYGETRRRHPLAGEEDTQTGIMRERELLNPLHERAHLVIDTSGMTPLQLASQLMDSLALEHAQAVLVQFISFGYKRGLPIEADIVLDMRFLPNPFYDPALRKLSGQDAPVRAFLQKEEATAPFFRAVEDMLSVMLSGCAGQGKQHVVVAFGCTGGRHRSVFAAEEMAGRLAQAGYTVRCAHRDFRAEAQSISARFAPEEQA